jgi:hypothetical protein
VGPKRSSAPLLAPRHRARPRASPFSFLLLRDRTVQGQRTPNRNKGRKQGVPSQFPQALGGSNPARRLAFRFEVVALLFSFVKVSVSGKRDERLAGGLLFRCYIYIYICRGGTNSREIDRDSLCPEWCPPTGQASPPRPLPTGRSMGKRVASSTAFRLAASKSSAPVLNSGCASRSSSCLLLSLRICGF